MATIRLPKALPDVMKRKLKGKKSSPSRSIVMSVIFIAASFIFICDTTLYTAPHVPTIKIQLKNKELGFSSDCYIVVTRGHCYLITPDLVTGCCLGNVYPACVSLFLRRPALVLLLLGRPNRCRRSHRHLRLTPSFWASSVSLIESWCSSTKRWK